MKSWTDPISLPSAREYDGGVSTPTVEYVRGSDYGGGIGGILYTLRSGSPSFKHYNSRGDVVAATDGTGSLTYQAAYEAFARHGDTPSSEEWGSTVDRQQSNTKDEDGWGALNEGFRYRLLDEGVFMTPDPLGFVDGPNVYTYVVQNPWTKFDPLGLNEEDVEKVDKVPDAWKDYTPEQINKLQDLAVQGAEESARKTVNEPLIKEYSYSVFEESGTGEFYLSDLYPGDVGDAPHPNTHEPRSPNDKQAAWGHSHPSNNPFSGQTAATDRSGNPLAPGEWGDVGVTNSTNLPGYVGRNFVKDPISADGEWSHTITVDRVLPSSSGGVGDISTVSTNTSSAGGPRSVIESAMEQYPNANYGIFDYNARYARERKPYHENRIQRTGY